MEEYYVPELFDSTTTSINKKSDFDRIKYYIETKKFFHLDGNKKDKYLNSSTDEFGSTLLHVAVLFSNKSAVEVLLRQGADPNIKNIDGATPLHLAKDVDIAKLLIDNGGDINAKGDRDTTSLCKAFFRSDKNLQSIKYSIATHTFSHLEDNEKDKYLNCSLDEFGSTPLHIAVLFQNKSAVEVLLRQGADPNIKNNKGDTPLLYTSDVDIAKLLIDNGGDINAKDNRGKTLLYKAFCSSDMKLAEFLLENHADFKHAKKQCGLKPNCSKKKFLEIMWLYC